MTENLKDQALLRDALNVFEGWLCGEGVTSPGVFADNDVLAEEIERLEELKLRAGEALALIEQSERIRAELRHAVSEHTGVVPAQTAASLTKGDMHRIKAALEVCIDEYGGLNLLIGASPARVVVSTSADPTQDAHIVIDLPKG